MLVHQRVFSVELQLRVSSGLHFINQIVRAVDSEADLQLCQVYNSQRRSVEFAITAAQQREERLNALVKAIPQESTREVTGFNTSRHGSSNDLMTWMIWGVPP